MALTKEQILGADDLHREEVKVPEWGGSVWVRTLTGMERDAWEEFWVSQKDRSYHNMRAHIVAMTACDETGTLLFTRDDADALGQKAAVVLHRLCEVATRLNKITKKDIEDLAGNSGGDPSGASTSA